MTMPPNPPICTLCKHMTLPPKGRPKCRAFPRGIPDDILNGGTHDSFIGDEPVVFEPADDVTPEEVDNWREIHLGMQKQAIVSELTEAETPGG